MSESESKRGALDSTQIAAWNSDGALFPITILDRQSAADHRQQLEAVEQRLGPMHYKVKPYTFFQSAALIATNDLLLDAIESILGPDILLWDSAYVIKEPYDNKFVSWHQDLTYWGLNGSDVVTAWVALTPANPDNGGMEFIAGSHKQGQIAHHDTFGHDNVLHRGQTVDSALADPASAKAIALEAGQASLHHGWCLHSSPANRTKDRRIGLTIQYLAPHMKQLVDSDETATLVRGQDRYQHFKSEPIGFDVAKTSQHFAWAKEAELRKRTVYSTGDSTGDSTGNSTGNSTSDSPRHATTPKSSQHSF